MKSAIGMYADDTVIYFSATSPGLQGSRLTFKLASPVASDRFDSLAKTIFLLARYSIHHRIKSSKC